MFYCCTKYFSKYVFSIISKNYKIFIKTYNNLIISIIFVYPNFICMFQTQVVKTKDIQIFFNISYKGAYKKIIHLKDALSKSKKGIITVSEFCEYYEISEEDFYKSQK